MDEEIMETPPPLPPPAPPEETTVTVTETPPMETTTETAPAPTAVLDPELAELLLERMSEPETVAPTPTTSVPVETATMLVNEDQFTAIAFGLILIIALLAGLVVISLRR